VVTATEPTFLYPHSRQFPFDEVCEQIVRALEERNYNDTAAVTEIVIPRKELHVYDDESGPTFRVYVGKNWPKDQERWFNGSKVNSKLNGEPRWYLQYSGGCFCGQAGTLHIHTGQRNAMLVHTNDLGREYDRKGREPKQYYTKTVFLEFTKWLESNVLAWILKTTRADQKIDVFRESITSYPDHLGPIFCFGENKDAHRVHTGRTKPEELEASDRYGFTGGGYRLMSLGTGNDGTVPEIAYDGFKWCAFGEIDGQTPIDTLDVPGHYRWSDREQYVFRVIPNRADGIYVADHALFDKRRGELFEEIKPRDRLTDAEVAEATRARARTIVPITEYAGGYEQPVVLIGRELDFDEVELISGPWPECAYVRLLAARFSEEEWRNPLAVAMTELAEYHHTFKQADRDAFTDAVQALFALSKDDEELTKAAEDYGRHTYRDTALTRNFIEKLVYTAVEMRDLGLF
jgi:hypothetical protein